MLPGDIGEFVGLAIAAAQQKHQSFVRQFFDGDLVGVQFYWIRQAAVFDDGVGHDREVAGRCDEPPHRIAESIEIGPCRNRRNRHRRDFVTQLLRTLAVRVEEANHHGWLRTSERQFIPVTYEHDLVPTLARAVSPRAPAFKVVNQLVANTNLRPISRAFHHLQVPNYQQSAVTIQGCDAAIAGSISAPTRARSAYTVPPREPIRPPP